MTENQITKEQIEKYQEARVEACQKAIEQALSEFNCELTAKPIYTDDGRTVAVMELRAK